MRPFVRVRAIILLLAGVFACMTFVRVARAGGSSPSTSTPTNVETDDAHFQRLKAEGDRALAEKRLSDAIKAYNAALDVRRDPLIAGRMGLTISYFDDPLAFEAAAGLLNDAVTDAAGATSQEKDAFFTAYKRMRKLVCKLSITTNDVNTVIDLGEGFKPRLPAFFTFVKKGTGEAVAKLDGRDDIRKTWDCKGDHDIELRFDFPPPVAASAETTTVTEKGKETVKVVYIPTTPENPPKATNGQKRFTLSLGPVIVFGASPSFAFGANLGGNYSFGKFSAMFAARGAWSSGTIGHANINASVLAAMGGPCARWKWLDGCLALSITSLQLRAVENSHYFTQTDSQVIPGLGATFGMTQQFSPAFGLRFGGDFTVLSDRITFTQEAQNQFVQTWGGGRIVGGLTLMAILSP